MTVNIAYGQGTLPVELPSELTTVIEPVFVEGLRDEKAALFEALERPVGARPLREWITPRSRVCVTFTDITRATPNHRLIPWILEYLKPLVPDGQILLLNSLGTHRPNTRAELERMLTPEVVANCRIVDNEPENEQAHVSLGVTKNGTPVLLNRNFVEADARIVTGFIEPHFFAGFSGGPKGVMPGVAHRRTVLGNHCARLIGDERATWGVTEGNPLWEEMRDIALRAGPSFLVNVTLNERREITGVFAGDLVEAHRKGTAFVRQTALRPVSELFDIVITSNSGYPLDLNLYQGVKGMSAAARIVKPGGLVILACECRDGLPYGSAYEKILRSGKTPEEILAQLLKNTSTQPDQWQVQIQAQVQRKAQVMVYSSLPESAVRAAHLTPCADISAAVKECLLKLGGRGKIAVLPQGPLTIPYLAEVS